MSKRGRFSDEFKAKIGLETIQGDQTFSQIAARHKLHTSHPWTFMPRGKLRPVRNRHVTKYDLQRTPQLGDRDKKVWIYSGRELQYVS